MVNEPEGVVPYDKNRYSKRKRLLIVYSQISILYVLPKIYETLRTMCMNRQHREAGTRRCNLLITRRHRYTVHVWEWYCITSTFPILHDLITCVLANGLLGRTRTRLDWTIVGLRRAIRDKLDLQWCMGKIFENLTRLVRRCIRRWVQQYSHFHLWPSRYRKLRSDLPQRSTQSRTPWTCLGRSCTGVDISESKKTSARASLTVYQTPRKHALDRAHCCPADRPWWIVLVWTWMGRDMYFRRLTLP